MKTIHLHGALGKKFGRVHKLDCSNIAMACSGIESNNPGFRAAILESGARFAVIIGDIKDEKGRDNLTEITMQMNLSDKDQIIHIVPEIVGNKEGFFQFVIGIVLFVVGTIYMQPWLQQMGIGIALGGVAAMLAPTPQVGGDAERVDEKASFLFNGAVNKSEQGGPIPLVYGTALVGSTVINVSVDLWTADDFGDHLAGYNVAGSRVIS